jgi:hypothetical protein
MPACSGETMEDYRAYVIGSDGHIMNRVDFSCQDDEAAKERAQRLVADYDIELWHLDRKIAVFHAKQ